MWNFLKIENNFTEALVSKTKWFGSNNYFQNSFKAQSIKYSKCLRILLYCDVLLLLRNTFSEKTDQSLTYTHQRRNAFHLSWKHILMLKNFMLDLIDNVWRCCIKGKYSKMVLYNFFLSNQMTHEALFKDFICVLLKRMKDGN